MFQDPHPLLAAIPRSPHRRHERDRFFKYVTPTTGVAIVQTRRRRWSSPLLFNDPFDVPRSATFGFTDDELLAGISAEFVRVVESDEMPDDASVRELVLRLRQEANPHLTAFVASTLQDAGGPMAPVVRRTQAEFRRNWEETLPGLRVFCVSEIADSVLMWAHYASTHCGFVLQFGVSDELDSSLLLAEPVIYRPEPPSLPPVHEWSRIASVADRVDWQQVFREYYYVKSPDWAYEREWRVVTFSPDSEPTNYTDTGFHPLELQGVYVGAASRPEDVSAMEQLLAHQDFAHVEMWRARHDHESRQIVFDPSRRAPSNATL